MEFINVDEVIVTSNEKIDKLIKALNNEISKRKLITNEVLSVSTNENDIDELDGDDFYKAWTKAHNAGWQLLQLAGENNSTIYLIAKL